MEIFWFIRLSVDGRYLTSISALKKKKKSGWDLGYNSGGREGGPFLLSLLSFPSAFKTRVNNFTYFTSKKSSLQAQLNESMIQPFEKLQEFQGRGQNICYLSSCSHEANQPMKSGNDISRTAEKLHPPKVQPPYKHEEMFPRLSF